MVTIDPSSFIFARRNIPPMPISNEIPFATNKEADPTKKDQFVSTKPVQDSTPKPQVQQPISQNEYKQRQETWQADQNEKNIFKFLTKSFKNLVGKLGVGNSNKNNLILAVLNSILPNLEKMAGKSVDLTKNFINTMTKMFSRLENKALKSSPLKGEEKDLNPIQNLMIKIGNALASMGITKPKEKDDARIA